MLEETPELCSTSCNSMSCSARNINVLKDQEWLSHTQSSKADLPNTWENHFSVELCSYLGHFSQFWEDTSFPFVVSLHWSRRACAVRELQRQVRFSGLACDQITLSSNQLGGTLAGLFVTLSWKWSCLAPITKPVIFLLLSLIPGPYIVLLFPSPKPQPRAVSSHHHSIFEDCYSNRLPQICLPASHCM